VTRVPVGLQIEQSGEYKINVRRNNVRCTIVDAVTGVRTTDCTVYLNAGTYEGRFSVEIGDSVSTSIQHSAVSDQSVRKVMVNGILYIEKGGKKYIIR